MGIDFCPSIKKFSCEISGEWVPSIFSKGTPLCFYTTDYQCFHIGLVDIVCSRSSSKPSRYTVYTDTVWSESQDTYVDQYVIFDRTERAQEKFENSQNIAHLPRNMCKKKSTRISHALVLCASFRETM